MEVQRQTLVEIVEQNIAEPKSQFEMSYRSSTTSLLFVSAVICLAEALQELNEKTIGTEKDSKIAAKSTEGLQQANCFATVLSKKNCAGSATCECSIMFEPQCATFLLKHSFTGFTASTGFDGNPEADGLPSCRVKRYKKGLGRHATGPSARFERPSWFMC